MFVMIDQSLVIPVLHIDFKHLQTCSKTCFPCFLRKVHFLGQTWQGSLSFYRSPQVVLSLFGQTMSQASEKKKTKKGRLRSLPAESQKTAWAKASFRKFAKTWLERQKV